jgi:glutamate 5-kinase
MPELAETQARPAALIQAARRITVKVGSSLLVDASGDGVRRDWLRSLGEDIGRLRKSGKQSVIVSSGAVALGRRQLSLKKSGGFHPSRPQQPPGSPCSCARGRKRWLRSGSRPHNSC